MIKAQPDVSLDRRKNWLPVNFVFGMDKQRTFFHARDEELDIVCRV